MKKFVLLPVAALMILGACSNDEPEKRPTPNDPIVTVPSEADHVTLNAPAQTDIKVEGTLYRVYYSNGQEIVYSFANYSSTGYIATIKKIEGSAADVVVPASVVSGDLTYKVYTIDLYQNAVSDNVTSLTLPNTCNTMYTSTGYKSMTAEYFRVQLEHAHNLQKIELEDGYGSYCSINGAIYTSDFTTLVGVPRAYTGSFTVAADTEIIDERAFYYCRNIDAITIPAGVTEIGDQAVVFNDNLLLVNILATEAPLCPRDAFGKAAHDGVLRVPAGCEANYQFRKPELEMPTAPVKPSADASDEEQDAYVEAMQKYDEDLKAYQDAMYDYEDHEGWAGFKNIEGANF